MDLVQAIFGKDALDYPPQRLIDEVEAEIADGYGEEHPSYDWDEYDCDECGGRLDRLDD
jgi:hypothetical protein